MLVPGPARPGLRGIAALDHEVRHDAVEDRVVEEAVPGERDQRRRRVRRELGVQADGERSAARLEHEPVAHACVERLRRGFVRSGLAGSGRLDALALIARGGRLVVAHHTRRRAAAERRRLPRARRASRAILSTWPSRDASGRRAAPSQMLEHHDEEWGVPIHDDRHLFELLTLEGAQAGLSWSTILSKREGYRRAFAGFDPAAVARFAPEGRRAPARGHRHRPQPAEGRVDGGQRRAGPRGAGGARQLRRLPVGVRRRRAGRGLGGARSPSSRRRPTSRGRFRRISSGAASASSGRRSATRSCRPSGWSTTTRVDCFRFEELTRGS